MADPAQQVEPPDGPPVGALSLSQIITQIESRPDFAFIKDIDWEDGRYEVEYRTRDGRDRNLKVDPRTGRPVEGALPMVQWPRS
ncbi:MAG: PepSY domain-containing protein [Alphaproteobacteria bacterium]|nr:PepSY domain-containing protein [Alphaproteobacteria bacterium]